MLRRTAWLLPVLLASACGGASPPAPTARSQPTTPAPVLTPPPPLAPAPASTSDPACAAALPYFNAIRSAAAQPAPELAALRGAYVGTAVQTLVKASDADTGRNDDAALIAALDADGPGAFITAEFLLHGALSQRLRHNLELASKDKDPAKRAAAWSAARCAWEQHLRHLGSELSPETGGDEDIKDAVADIDAAFTAGAAALAAEPIDERVLRPGHETIEKSWFRIIHRALAAAATRAHKDGDALAARRALGLFQLLRDRLQDRNTPGIARVEAQLGGDPKQLDPAAVMREIDIALVKRARKYASHSLEAHLTGVDGLTSVTEGLAYTRILLPGMRAAIRDPAFDPEAHVAAWQQFADSVEAAEPEPDELKKLSADLVHWNCAYQQALGVRECTATADEHAKP